MVVRIWKATSSISNTESYIKHLERETFAYLNSIDGFLNGYVLRKDKEITTELIVLTIWESLDAVKKFAGENVNKAVVPKKVEKLMISFEKEISHYEIALKA